MKFTDQKYQFIRSTLFLALFVGLHYLFDFFPNAITQIFSGTDESLYQHLKIGFYSYLLLIIIEYFVFQMKATKEDKTSFLFASLLGLILIPWFIFVFWYTIVTFTGMIQSLILEILYSISITYICCLSLSFIQLQFLNIKFTIISKIIIAFMVIFLIIQFTLFTLKIPDYGFFLDPLGE